MKSRRNTRYSVVHSEVGESPSGDTRGIGSHLRAVLRPIPKKEAQNAGKVENKLSYCATAGPGTIDKFFVIAPTIKFSVPIVRRRKIWETTVYAVIRGIRGDRQAIR
ncbi:hypothetical protein QCA50_000638 [Cerrena zonata]|uniref:Uncharacterized protein n=1 Tax=Cerrena zonata TaxID=2478898 RepID=A0AAW0GQW5_9APHY